MRFSFDIININTSVDLRSDRYLVARAVQLVVIRGACTGRPSAQRIDCGIRIDDEREPLRYDRNRPFVTATRRVFTAAFERRVFLRLINGSHSAGRQRHAEALLSRRRIQQPASEDAHLNGERLYRACRSDRLLTDVPWRFAIGGKKKPG
jgi:hypothetical protein